MDDPPHLPFYNISSLLAKLPGSRILRRLRRAAPENHVIPSPDTVILTELDWPPTFTPETTIQAQPATTSTTVPVDQLSSSLPGPWGFFTSGYMLGLLLMAVLLHRMQNIIIPSRVPPRRSRRAYRFAPTSSFTSALRFSFNRIYASLLPLNFSNTSTRLALHLPSIYYLSKMLLLWFLLVLQTCDILPLLANLSGPDTPSGLTSYVGPVLARIQQLAEWSKQKEMGEICWSTFCAVCSAFLVEGFIKALDGIGSGFPIGNVNPNASPFNLVGYAFLLHVYSSPIAHAYHPEDNYPSRPDKHVIMTIAIPLLQLTIFHILSVSKRLSTHRLLPTALTSFLSLTHFHGTLFSHFFGFPFSSSSSPKPSPTTGVPGPSSSSSSDDDADNGRKPYMASTSYPLLNYIPNIFETLLICTIMLTVFLNVVVQLLVRGRVDRVFSGLGVAPAFNDDSDEDLPPAHANNPNPNNTNSSWSWFCIPTQWLSSLPMDEDFGVLLLRIGTASLEATGLRGWGNEVAPIRLTFPPPGGNGRLGRRRTVAMGRGIQNYQSGFEPVGYQQQQQQQPQNAYGTVSLGRVSVGDVRNGMSVEMSGGHSNTHDSSAQAQATAAAYMFPPPHLSPYTNRYPTMPSPTSHSTTATLRIRTNRGLRNEVRNVDLGTAEPGAAGMGGGGPGAGAGVGAAVDPGTYWQQWPLQQPQQPQQQSPFYQPQAYAQQLPSSPSSGHRRATGSRTSIRHSQRMRFQEIQRRRQGSWWARWFREFRPFVSALWGVMKGCVVWLVEFARRGGMRGLRDEDEDEVGVDARGGGGEGQGDEGLVGQRGNVLEQKAAHVRGQFAPLGWAVERVGDRDRDEEEDVYVRFLNGEDISDDDDFEAEDEGEEDLSGEEGEDDEDEGPMTPRQGGSREKDGDEDEEAFEAEAFSLFKDFLQNGFSTSQSQPRLRTPNHPSSSSPSASSSQTPLTGGELVLAHILHGSPGSQGLSTSSAGPLTRTRWNAMMQASPVGKRSGSRYGSPAPGYYDDDDYDDEEGYEDDGDEDGMEFGGGYDLTTSTSASYDRDVPVSGSACVICTTEAREIICWPCRCLTMCDHCRESMASRSAPTKHRCPCCRQTVEGYSRIYIP